MKFNRSSGVLLHPTSLPGSYGIGTIGKEAYKFIDWLSDAGQSLWQVLPLGPTGYGDSPYASFSTFAGNPLLIDLDMLVKSKWALNADVQPASYIKKDGPIDFGAVVWWKTHVLNVCAEYFLNNASKTDIELYKQFCKDKKSWLDDYAIFMSIKNEYDKKASEEQSPSSMWNIYWPKVLASRDPEAIKLWQSEHASDIEKYKVIQFFFNYQWTELKKYANENGIKIIGDIPIFVAPDSADVWANQELFQLNEDGRPNCVSGVPPDYFSATGQLWGNPLYDWNKVKATGYDWWIQRIKRVFELTDILRIDHFRGFEAYWSVPAGEETAMNGKWIPGPGMDLFKAIKKKLGDLPIIAEDLGVITDEVRKLRDDCAFPGMKIMQYAFSVDEVKNAGMINAFLPHMYETSECVAYTGTHDNETMQGWLENTSDELLVLVAEYVEGKEVALGKARNMVKSGALRKALIKSVFASNAVVAVVPFQDLAGVGNEGRMNHPSTTGTNWVWRMEAGALKKSYAKELQLLSTLYGRNLE